jgi:exopolysaccharide biosynthesis polyprenyl glycosylphosphotransferase
LAHVAGHEVLTAREPLAERLLPLGSGVLALFVNAGLIYSAFVLAFWARFIAPDMTDVALGFEQYTRIAVMVASVATVLCALHGLLNLSRATEWWTQLQAIVSSVSTAMVLVMAASYFLGDQSFSRLWFATAWLIAIVLLVIWRSLAQYLYSLIRGAVASTKRVIIVGANRLGRELSEELQGEYEVVGYVDNGSDLNTDLGAPLLGSIAQLEHLVQSYSVSEVIIALPANRREQVSRVIERGFRRPVTVKFVPELAGLLPQRFDVHEYGGRRYIGFAPMASVSWIKRAMDLILVSAGLVVISPVLVAAAIAIKLDSRGPIFYRQQRVGKHGRTFWMFKFRSMIQDAEHHLELLRAQNEAIGPLFKMRADPRVTRVGGFLRRWSIDELPQLLNVLRGEMSLVGPRPPIPSEVDEYEDWQLGRLRAVPGLTGLWQVSGRSEVPFHDMVRLDLHYIRNWSLGLDFEILLRTIPAVLTNRGAY